MRLNSLALAAYKNTIAGSESIEKRVSESLVKPEAPVRSFTETMLDSLNKVNQLEGQKTDMVQAFVSGQNQNVHELMITLQKAGLAVNMTSAVRGKVLDAYRELVKMQF